MRCFEVLNGQLAKSGGKSVLPGGFSAVDLRCYCWCRQWEFAGLDLAGLEWVRRWLEGVGGMEVVRKAYDEVPRARRGVDCL